VLMERRVYLRKRSNPMFGLLKRKKRERPDT
jgi:hypothetical protein